MDKQLIIDRLVTFGYTATEGDTFLIEFLITKITNHIKNYCNILEIPVELEAKAIDMICGEILISKASSGELNIEAAVSSIKEGDTQVSFNSNGDLKSQFVNYVQSLTNDKDLNRFRRIVW